MAARFVSVIFLSPFVVPGKDFAKTFPIVLQLALHISGSDFEVKEQSMKVFHRPRLRRSPSLRFVEAEAGGSLAMTC